MGELPKSGAVGTYGICGLSPDIAVYMKMLPSDGTYKFEPGKIYNLESTQYICKMDDGFLNRYTKGAHNHIAIPEVADAVWQAALGS